MLLSVCGRGYLVFCGSGPVRSDCVSPLLARKRKEEKGKMTNPLSAFADDGRPKPEGGAAETVKQRVLAVPFVFPQPASGSAVANFENSLKSSPLEKLLLRRSRRDPNVFGRRAHAAKVRAAALRYFIHVCAVSLMDT